MDSVDKSKLKEKIAFCNAVNSGDKDGIGNETENLEIEQVIWKLYKVKNIFKLLGSDIEYHIVHTKMREEGRPLVVIPGYSDKSICWTMGEMNRYLTTMPECFNKFSDM
jgi:hypothetical protein